jgi:hypothetical protein
VGALFDGRLATASTSSGEVIGVNVSLKFLPILNLIARRMYAGSVVGVFHIPWCFAYNPGGAISLELGLV